MRAVWTAIAVAGGLGLSALAGSASAGTVMYDFQGTCRDCASYGLGTLTLSNPVNGPLTKNDFVSFVYRSNLVSFQLNSSDIVAVMGSIDPDNLGASYIDILQLGGTGWEFDRNADGSWSISSELTQGNWKPTSGGGAGGGGGGGSQGDSGSSFTIGFPGGSPGSSFFSSDDPTREVDDIGPSSDLTASVPEASTWALMLVGFGGLGAMLRTRRRGLRGIETA